LEDLERWTFIPKLSCMSKLKEVTNCQLGEKDAFVYFIYL